MVWFLTIAATIALAIVAFLLYEQMKTSQSLRRDLQVLSQQMVRLDQSQSGTRENVAWMADLVEGMHDTFAKPKARGTWGEYQLEHLLESFVGRRGQLWERQVKLASGRIADTALLLPGSDALVCIDAKFPLENFQENGRAFRGDVKKQIDDIADKYITEQTADFALMFIPAEGVFEQVLSQHEDIFEYGLQRHVLMAGPGTLAGILTVVASAQKDWYRKENMEKIVSQLADLQTEADRLKVRAEKAEQSSRVLADKYHEVYVSCRKIHEVIGRILEEEQ